MAPEQMHILRVPLSDSSEDAYVLINVSSNGPSPLDLILLATEGTAPYIATIKPSRITKLRSKRNPLTPTDWETTLQFFLCQHKHSLTSPPLQAKDLSKLEASASLSPTDDTLTLHLRHNISGILLSLGSITFTKDESQEIDIFAWCSLSVQHSTTLQTSIQHLNEQFAEQKETVGKLEHQLEELIQAKKTHEEELLAKFARLLNEKKLKIREQQRLLASAKLDPNAAKKVAQPKQLAKGHTPQPSRKGKRKVDVKDESESGNEDAFEIDNHRVATAGGPGVEDTDGDDGEEQVETPELSDQDVTEDDDDGGGDDDLDTRVKDQDAAGKHQGEVEETHNPSKDAIEEMQIDSLPPSRALPFGNHNSNANVDASAGKETVKEADKDRSVLNQEAGNEDDETEGDEDDDDEL